MQIVAIKQIKRRLQRWICPSPLPPSETSEGQCVLARLKREFDLDWLGLHANPLDNIGDALSLADHYHIRLKSGITRYSCIAYLPKEEWKAEPTPAYIPNGTWVDRPTICDAVCSCLLSCRGVGVL